MRTLSAPPLVEIVPVVVIIVRVFAAVELLIPDAFLNFVSDTPGREVNGTESR